MGQDQIGGVMGGINRGYSPADVKVNVGVEKLPLSKEFVTELNERILLIYTGKVRLARNLVQNVIRNWYAREETTVKCFHQLVENANTCANGIRQGDIAQIGRCANVSNSQKNVIARGCTPFTVGKLADQLRPLVHGQCLAGAGGGGFMFAILKEKVDRSVIQSIISSIEGTDKFTIHAGSVEETGITLSVDGEHVKIPYTCSIP